MRHIARYQAVANRTEANPFTSSNAVAELLRDIAVFTFVREPIDTFLSGYRELASRLSLAADVAKVDGVRFMNTACTHKDSTARLSKFIAELREGALSDIEAFHVWPQALKIDALPVGRSFDFIGRSEHLERDVAELFRRHSRVLLTTPGNTPGSLKLRGRGATLRQIGERLLSSRVTANWSHSATRTLPFRPNASTHAGGDLLQRAAACGTNVSLLSADEQRTICDDLLAVDLACLGYTSTTSTAFKNTLKTEPGALHNRNS